MKVLQATDGDGKPYVLALGDKEPRRAYLLLKDKKTGVWGCDCFMAKWKGACAHLEAVEQAMGAAPLGQDADSVDGQQHGDEDHQQQEHGQPHPPGRGRHTVHAGGSVQGVGQETNDD